LIPVLVFSALWGAALALGVAGARPWLLERLPHASWYSRLGADAASIALIAVVAVLGWLLAALLTPPLSAPALEHIVARVEAELGLPTRPALGFLRELLCGFRATCGAALIGGALMLVLWLLELSFPPSVLVTVPARFLLGALLVAWSLFDYPLTLQGVGFRARLSILRANLRCALGFGATFALLFWLPFCGIALLPVGVAAATLVVARLRGQADLA
jgi:uncharacterized protein involved in cysteine biosynthesis